MQIMSLQSIELNTPFGTISLVLKHYDSDNEFLLSSILVARRDSNVCCIHYLRVQMGFFSNCQLLKVITFFKKFTKICFLEEIS
jgi:hypothetical protein